MRRSRAPRFSIAPRRPGTWARSIHSLPGFFRCAGESTKFAGYMLAADKTYEALVRLGPTTSTGDPEGEQLSESPVSVGTAEVEQS
jgi:hypothetical protein